jgi:hypothetical protein
MAQTSLLTHLPSAGCRSPFSDEQKEYLCTLRDDFLKNKSEGSAFVWSRGLVDEMEKQWPVTPSEEETRTAPNIDVAHQWARHRYATVSFVAVRSRIHINLCSSVRFLVFYKSSPPEDGQRQLKHV